MLPESTLAIVARNERWSGTAATEPYECGWAREAMLFVRALEAEGAPGRARVQVAPDGMHWVDEGTAMPLPSRVGESTMAKVAGFGGFLRLVAELPPGSTLTVIVSLHLKA
jgi:hypothetical protein